MTGPVFNRPVAGALYCMDKGFKVFPLRPGAKTPAVKDPWGWARAADIKKVRDFGTANPTYNWAVACGESGLTVIDLDVKGERDGLAVWETLKSQKQIEYGQTLTVQTPTGGMHIYFRGLSRSSASTIGAGVDTRSAGGYVVAPGSVLGEDQGYTVTSDAAEVAELPDALAILIGERRKDPDPLPESIPEGERNQTLTSLAGTLRRRGAGYDTILAALSALNATQIDTPVPDHEVEHIARSVARYAPEHAQAASDFLELPEVSAWRGDSANVGSLPARDWILGRRYLGQFISVLISPGGVGKSMICLLDAISVASGKPLSGDEVVRQGPVWLYNTEDPDDEMRRRLLAAAAHYQLTPDDLKDVHITSGRSHPLILAKTDQGGVSINVSAIDSITQYIQEHNIVLFLVDPLVRAHEVAENDNMQMDKVIWCFQRIADRTGCAIGLVHHTNKSGASVPGDANTARGASAVINAARVAHTVSNMSAEDAVRLGITEDERRWYLRMDSAKANLAPPAESAVWYQRHNVRLANGDDVGVLAPAKVLDLQKAHRDRELESDRAALAWALYEYMDIDQEYTLADIVTWLMTSPAHSHVLDRYTSKRAAEKRVIELIRGASLHKDDKQFRLYMPYSSGGRYRKKMIVCTRVDTMFL